MWAPTLGGWIPHLSRRGAGTAWKERAWRQPQGRVWLPQWSLWGRRDDSSGQASPCPGAPSPMGLTVWVPGPAHGAICRSQGDAGLGLTSSRKPLCHLWP